MKTQIFKSIAIFSLSVLVFTVYAQNTRSLKKYPYDQLLAVNDYRSEMTTADDLNVQLLKMVNLVKYYPAPYNSASAEPMLTEVIENLSMELEKDVKFHPEESIVNTYEMMIFAEEINTSLEEKVRFNPSDSELIRGYDLEDDFEEIQSELSKIVKYKPTIIP
jgi:hypothetical protein